MDSSSESRTTHLLKCTGYHGTSPDAAEEVLKSGFKLSGDNSWLGPGVYFFGDLRPIALGKRDARNWVLHVRKEAHWAILKSRIFARDALDLLQDIEDKRIFDDIGKEMLKKHNASNKSSLRFKDSYIFLEIDRHHRFDAVRALVEARKWDHPSYVVQHPQVQVCVKNLAAIVQTELDSKGATNV